MEVLGSANFAFLNFSRAQHDLLQHTSALASGLRITSASDDPSGLAISQTIASHVAALQHGIENVQDASNLLTVSDGALSTVASMLRRIHALTIEAHTDFASDSDLAAIQSEMNSLLTEINTVTSKTTFNGVRLFDGSHGSGQAVAPSAAIVAAETNPDGTVPRADVYDAVNSGTPNSGAFIQNPRTQPSGIAAYIQFQVISYSTNPVDPITGPLGVPGVIVRASAYSQNPAFGAAPLTVQDTALPTNAGPNAGTGSSLQISSPSGTQIIITFDLANLSPQDVGVAVSVILNPGQAASHGTPLQVHDGPSEGDMLAVTLPSCSTASLNIADVSVLRPAMVDAFNTPIGLSSSNAIAADDAQVRLENAIQAVGAVRAQVGAQLVSLRADASDNATAVVNQAASESRIRDADIAQTSAQFVRDQITSSVGLSVFAQIQTEAKLVIHLLTGTLTAPNARAAASP